MPIRKKAMAVLTFSAIAFLIAMIIFYNRTDSLKEGPVTSYLGETEINIYNTYLEGEKQLLFIDTAAYNSFRKAGKFIEIREEELHIKKPIETLKANPEQFIRDFSGEFGKYLAEFNKAYPGAELKAEDYIFRIDSRGLFGLTEKEIMISTEYHDYTFSPNFRVFIETGITGEITYTPATGNIENAGKVEETPPAEQEIAPETTEAQEEEPVKLGAE
ncbi:MAG: hypothetical protein PHO02_02090 [Candidatus Nanoarchaeia archaeon]|nr:hypothetical protein [Candidatus Nanoarchaeia archaeon]